MAASQPLFTTNDAVLFVSLTYLSIDMQYDWQEFTTCHWPVHRWLLVSYMFIVAFRVMHILGTVHSASGSGDFLLNLRHKEAIPRLLLSATWLLVLPLFAMWTIVGTYWLIDSRRQSAQCLPLGMPFMFVTAWQVLSYAWIAIHASLGGVAWVLERRVRRSEHSLRQIEDADVLSRWGQVSNLSGYTSLSGSGLGGLTVEQIQKLPAATPYKKDSQEEEVECSICLNLMQSGDEARELSACGHCFHRSCIDLWLLRSTHCPLCKRDVQVETAASVHKNSAECWHV